jgi:hypothetical protein
VRERGIKNREDAEKFNRTALEGAAQGQVRTASVRISQLSAEVAACHAHVRASRYGRVVPPMDSPLTDATRVRLYEVAPSLDAMYRAAFAMWQQVGGSASMMGPETPLYHLHVYMHNHEYQFARRTKDLFWEQLESKNDLRSALTLLCLNYFDWRHAILLLGECAGAPAQTREGYVEWRQAETEFFGELRKLVANPELGKIREQVLAYFSVKGIAIPAAMPIVQLLLPLRISAKPITHFGPKRSGVSVQGDQSFRSMPITA